MFDEILEELSCLYDSVAGNATVDFVDDHLILYMRGQADGVRLSVECVKYLRDNGPSK